MIVIKKAVRQGEIGVGVSSIGPYILLQVDEDQGEIQARAVMTIDQAEKLIMDLKYQIITANLIKGTNE